MSEVTRILISMESDVAAASQELLPLVYEELRQLAASKLANEAPGQILQATALVHEAWIKLAGPISSRGKGRCTFSAPRQKP